MPGMNRYEKEHGYVNLTQVVNPETHKKMLLLCKNRRVSMKNLVQKLCDWAGENHDNALHLIRCGVDLPVWAEDREAFAALSESGRHMDR